MALLLLGLLITVPLVEIYLLVQVGQVIGTPATILALVAISLLGAVLVRREGWKAWRRFREALEAGRIPTSEVVDGALLVLGGALLLTPGFLTDAVGFALVVPVTRTGLRGVVRRRTGSRVASGPRDGDTVDVEVVSVERHDPPAPPEEVSGGGDGGR